MAVHERADQLRKALADTRSRTLGLVGGLDSTTLETVHSTLLSPLVWDLAHVACFEDEWMARAAGVAPLRPELFAVYDAAKTPRSRRGELKMLGTGETLAHMASVRSRTEELLAKLDAGTLDLAELVIRHEQQHNETMLQLLQLAHLPSPFAGMAGTAVPGVGGATAAARRAQSGRAAQGGRTAESERTAQGGLELIDIRGGVVTIGAPAEVGFAYDNERPAHVRTVPAFRLARTPATNADWLEFMDAGGYQRQELWSAEGWQWRVREAVDRPLYWTQDGQQWLLGRQAPIDGDLPVTHISWFEAGAFAAFHGLRLPTEFEWEAAATAPAPGGLPQPFPWGRQPVTRLRANVDQVAGGPAPAGTHDGATPSGLQSLIGDVWEWTASWFDGYPGFAAYPYREYSEPFFGSHYRVLRGGSWATRPLVISSTFRNWDFPQRRQIFAGVRLAGDL
ncbi:MAG: ergothioneine biosynthesis protein EgtB [Solirubrobacteraceae bacterium]